MAEMTVRPWLLRRAGEDCEADVTPQVAGAVTAFADARYAPAAAGMDYLACYGVANTCIAGWHETFREAGKAMAAVGDKLRATSGVVVATDESAVDLYRGDVPDLPTLSIDIGR